MRVVKKNKAEARGIVNNKYHDSTLELPLSNVPRKNIDFFIFVTVLVLLSFGTIMVFSSSAPHAYNLKGDTYLFIRKQITYASLGLVVMFVMMNYDYRKLGKISPILLGGSALLLLLVAIPGVGTVLNGARRWISIGGQTFQPTEIAKLAVILFLSHSLARRKDQLKSFSNGLLPYLVLIGFIAGLIMMEPHFSAVLIIGFVAMVILFCAGAKIKHFVMLTVPVFVMGSALVFTSEYRLKRILAFRDPWADPRGGGWQIVQSLIAIGSGSVFGRGLGRSLQKFLYIPEPYNDFIFAVMAEEFGFLGVCFVMLLFCVFVWRGIKVSMNAPDSFGSLLAAGITSLIGIQVVINIAVVTSSMPVTGMPLPFFSYGGTSLIFLLAGVGILLNISRYAEYERI